MPAAVVEEVCTITAKGQTTVPKAVRQALGVGYGGRIAFRVERGRVTVHALPEANEAADPALAPFLALLEANLVARPAEAVRPFPEALAGRLEALAAEVGEVDPNAPIEGEVSLQRAAQAVLERHGWHLHAHPLFLDQLERLLATVERARRADQQGWQGKADARLLAALRALVLDRIPRDPLAPEFRQGNTLGKEHRHWFRAKFGGSRFRLFFRADSRARVIVYAWVNDRDTLRKAGASSDPYAVFAGMLAGGNPPDDWPALLTAARAPEAERRFGAASDETG